MLHVLNALGAFRWFLWQCSIVGGVGAGWFWIPFASALAWLVVSYRQTPTATRRRFWWLAMLPAMWAFVGIWGGYFWVDWQQGGPRNPAWVMWPVNYGLWTFLFVSTILVFALRNGRAFAASFALTNLYFMLFMSFLASMAVTGDWL